MRRLAVSVLGTELLAVELGTPEPRPKKDKGPRMQASGSLQDSGRAEGGQTWLGVGFTPTGGGR